MTAAAPGSPARPEDEDPATYFHGHTDRECGEHRTVGAHRAWCYDCGEWCYPRLDAACRGCEMPNLRAELAAARAENSRLVVQLAAVTRNCQEHHDTEGLDSRVEYGHMTEEFGWVPEIRGVNYATHQRTVHFRVDEPVVLDHWTYADHRHPVEGCTHDRHDLTTEAAVRSALSSAGPDEETGR